MNLIVIAGFLQKDFTYKNGVATSSIKSDKTFFNVVGFGVVADECINYRADTFVIIQGKLQQKLYNEKVYWQIVITTISEFGEAKETPPQIETNEEKVTETETIGEEDLPF